MIWDIPQPGKDYKISWWHKNFIKFSFNVRTPVTSTSSYAELDLSVHSTTTVKCEPDTTHKDTKVNDDHQPPRSPYLDYHHHPFTSYGDNNNDLQAKMDSLHQYSNQQYSWNQYGDAYGHPASIGDIRYKVWTFMKLNWHWITRFKSSFRLIPCIGMINLYHHLL